MSEHTINISGGHMRFVYDDALVDLLAEGTTAVCRVSHVEPFSGQAGQGWIADMAPVGGPVLFDVDGVQPFKTRKEALAAERAWLTKERGL